MTVSQLGERKWVSPRRDETADVLRRRFEAAGVEFIDENGGGPGVRLRGRETSKKRT